MSAFHDPLVETREATLLIVMDKGEMAKEEMPTWKVVLMKAVLVTGALIYVCVLLQAIVRPHPRQAGPSQPVYGELAEGRPIPIQMSPSCEGSRSWVEHGCAGVAESLEYDLWM